MTVKQLSVELGVSEQAIRQRCSKAGIEIETVKVGKSAHVTSKVESTIRKLYEYRKEALADAVQAEQQKDIIAKLQAQLDEAQASLVVSADQIESLEKQVAELQKELNDKNQFVAILEVRTQEKQAQLDQANQFVSIISARLPAPRRSVRQWFHDTFVKTQKKP